MVVVVGILMRLFNHVGGYIYAESVNAEGAHFLHVPACSAAAIEPSHFGGCAVAVLLDCIQDEGCLFFA